MMFLAIAPLLVGLILSRFSRQIARLLTPAHAVRLLTGLALTVALSTGLVLSLVAVLVCAQARPLAQIGHWSAPVLRSEVDLPVAFGVLACAVVLAAAVAAGRRAGRTITALWRAERAARRFQPISGDLVLIEDAPPTAYSIAARHGRIVVSTSMLSALSPDERRVLLAHEAAHLHHRHHLYLHLAHLAASANPLLRPTAETIAFAIERWADETAAAEVGDRRVAATSLARAALASAKHQPPNRLPALAAAEGNVTARVQALLEQPQPTSARPVAAVLIGAGALCWTAAATLMVWGNALVQVAESAYLRH